LATDELRRKRSELVYQAERASRIRSIEPTPDYVIKRYRRCALWRLFPREHLFKCLGALDGREILDFGCGEGVLSTQLALLGGRVTGIDISPELIDIARRRARLDGVEENIRFLVGDIVEMPIEPERFDVVICSVVLHHVNISSVWPRVLSVLKPGGRAIMVEPVNFSPILERVRNLIPLAKDASPGERQLRREEISFLLSGLNNIRVTFFDLFGRLSRLFPHSNQIDRGHPLTKAILISLSSLDRLLLTVLPSLSTFCSTVVIAGRKSVR
jgi:2-polyprenyl-3-methyl-5-hydroxy-6-metoxy-1,4-benzoquinol methylase